MRYSRLRLRSSIFFSLTTLAFFFLITLHTLIWSTAELEIQEQNSEAPKPPAPPPPPPAALTFWSALDQPNIYDVKATSSKKLINHSPYITSNRIDELFELVRNARHDQIDLSDKKKSHSIDSTWSFAKFVGQKTPSPHNDTNTHVDTADSAAIKQSNPILQFNLTTTKTTMNEVDKMQLRYFVHRVLTKWKQEHQNDKTVTLADTMHDALIQDEPA
jgi:hypothetical protein